MNTLIICLSIHKGNTLKIAKEMAEILKADIVKPSEVNPNKLAEYDLIGFGSGIYFGKHHINLLKFVDNLPTFQGKKAFILSTSGLKQGIILKNLFNRTLKNKLLKKGFEIVGVFYCIGFDTSGLFKLVGGINKGRPNEKDLQKAREFAKEIISKIKLNKTTNVPNDILETD